MSLIAPQDPVQWNHTPETIIIQTDKLISEAKALDDKIGSIDINLANIDSVIKPYADLENKQAGLSNQLSFYQHVSADKALREASNEADAKFRKYGIEAGLREDVFKAINKVYLDNKDNNELDPETRRFIEKLNKQYERNGLSLPLETRDKIKALKQELSTLALKFSSNLSEETGFNLYTKEELDGVPDDVINQFEQVKQDDGSVSYKMTFKYPDLFPVLKYAKDANTRKTAFTADQSKCPENADILIKAVKIRAELAKLLGYNNFSEYILEERMAKKPETVMNFLNDLKVKLKPLGEKEFDYLKSLKEKEIGKKDDEYYIWDHRYYHTKMLENDYNVDEIKIAQYFPMKNTIEKMLSIYETIFNLKFVEIEKSNKLYNTWHEDVKQFQVWKMDNKDPIFIGHLYFDLHPRTGKYGHAANFGLVPAYIDIETGKKNYPSTSLVCNFTKDTKEKPSLLKHGEVVTFFHELGHGIHDLMGQTQYSRFHGTSVSWDFVEMPSQLLEYFCWDEAMLTKLSSHYETGESLPKDLIKSLISSKNVNGAMFNLRQLHFGLFDMALHTSEDGNVDVDSLWNNMREEICLISNGGIDFKGYGSFGHLMGGYASGYYGYLWSNVFAADVFFTKFAKDPLNVTNGMEYRNKILARGGSRDEMDNLIDLLGREPESDAFLAELGLAK
jgi:saccharolysin